MPKRVQAAAVFLLAFLVLSWRAGGPGYSTAYVDPVGKIQAQDETVYAATSFQMAATGDWITPRFLGRLVLYKPPVLYWLSAACAKFLGEHPIAVRLPSILAGAATVALIFSLLSDSVPSVAALAGALLLLGSHLFFVLSRSGLMDALLTLETAAAMCILTRDPALESRRTALSFGFWSGAAIMTKALAGLFPLLVLCAVSAMRGRLPRLVRVAQVAAITAAVALPWHLWQLHLHPRWFWSEYVMTESLEKGNGLPEQSTQETQTGYYAERLALLDPVIIASALFGLRDKRARTALAVFLVVLVCALAFRYRNTSYLMPAYPALAILASAGIPARWPRAALAAAALLFVVKTMAPAAPWGLPFEAESAIPSQSALDAYAAGHRSNELIIAQPDDQFYGSLLHLSGLRYAYIDPRPPRTDAPLDFRHLGITVTAAEFAQLGELAPVFAQRLRDFDLSSTAPIATVILARDEADMRSLIETHPEADFYVPAPLISSAAHDLVQGAAGRWFLLSRVKIQRP
jgi:4-amino-4-deoxy-L-arabinose transferase-like glycosyltransferase